MIEVEHLTVDFQMANDRIQSLKEYAVAMLKGRLAMERFRALDDVSFSVRRGKSLG